MKIPRLLHLLAAATLLASCSKELDIKYHDIDPLTVIEGELTPEGIRVGITLTTPMDEPMDRTRLTDASVTLTDLTDGTGTKLTAGTDGYFTATEPGIPGHGYRLTVERQGAVYESETTMYPSSRIIGLEFSWIKMPYDHVAVLQGQFTDISAGEDFFWVKILRNGEMYQWGEMSDAGASPDGVLTFIAMTSRRDTSEEEDDTVLYDGDVLTVSVEPISREMYLYLEALQNDSNGPAMFTGIGPLCLGYFTATTPASSSIVFHPADLPVYE